VCRGFSSPLLHFVVTAVLCCVSCGCAACSYVGMDWARYIVALGALMGIVTTTLVSWLDAC